MVDTGSDTHAKARSAFSAVQANSAAIPLSALAEQPLSLTDVVIVESLADLPTPVAGVITLEAKRYLINGEVDLGVNRLVAVAGSAIFGHTRTTDRLCRTGAPTGALLTVPAGIGNYEVKSLELKTPAGAGTLFDVQGAGTNIFLTSLDCEGDVGSINATLTSILDCSITGFDDGLTLAGSNLAIAINGCSWRQASGGTGTGIDITGTYSTSITIVNTNFSADVGGISLDGLASSGNLGAAGRGVINNCNFNGTGTKIASNLDPDDLRWVHANNVGVPSSLAVGQYSMFSNASNTTLTGSNWAKALGTTVEDLARRFTHGTNRLTYNALTPKLMRVDVELNALAASPNIPAAFGVSINGADPVEGSLLELSNAVERGRTFFSVLELEATDYIEIFCRDTSGAAAWIRVTDLTVLVSAIATGT